MVSKLKTFFSEMWDIYVCIFLSRDATGKFPEFPDEDDGGSSLIFKEKSPEELEAEMKEKVKRYFRKLPKFWLNIKQN